MIKNRKGEQMAKDLYDELNRQLNRELYASHLYLATAAYFEAENFPGFAAWMKVQSDEERAHALKFWEFLDSRNARVELLSLDQPPSQYRSPLDAFQQALEHEKSVTEDIHKLYARSVDAKDFASQAFLQWFVSEQVEEEKTVSDIVDTLNMIGQEPTGLFMFDRELGQRGAAAAAGEAG